MIAKNADVQQIWCVLSGLAASSLTGFLRLWVAHVCDDVVPARRHLLILTPLLKTVNQGPASVPLLGTWALSALASTFIAISPETTEKDGL